MKLYLYEDEYGWLCSTESEKRAFKINQHGGVVNMYHTHYNPVCHTRNIIIWRVIDIDESYMNHYIVINSDSVIHCTLIEMLNYLKHLDLTLNDLYTQTQKYYGYENCIDTYVRCYIDQAIKF